LRETRITQLLAAAIAIAAVTLTCVKWLVAGITPGRTIPPLWHVDVRLSFNSSSPRSSVRLLLPRGDDGHAIVHEQFDDDGVTRYMSAAATSRNRSARWRETKRDQSHTLDYSIWLDNAFVKPAERAPTARQLERLRQPTKMIQADDSAIKSAALDLLKDTAKSERIAAVVNFVHRTIQNTHDNSAVSAVRCLKARQGSSRSMSRLACALLRSQGIACQVVGGVRLEEEVRTHAFFWAEAWDGQHWITLSPTHNIAKRRPSEYLTIFRGDYSLAKFQDCEESDLLVTVEQHVPPPPVEAQVIKRSPNVLDRISLATLPPDSRQLVRNLLVLPLGALLVACFRNLVGLNTFGIFMPILLALAFRETQLMWGFVYLSTLVGVGVIVRWGLNRLKLLMIPRLATVLTVIVSMMIGLVLLGSRFGSHPALSVGLFPMVIMTTTVERFFVIQSEDGTMEALKESLTTALVVSCTYLLFRWHWLREVLFVYPELLLLVVASLLLIGRYSGYRLMELRRFRWLAWGMPQLN
jgi:7 transmembrane helices usually fused to an inactive transglutaminase/Transglutaminase-like superfamily/Inactive transglutaminase fused to 7 transmembrane helices